MRARRTRRPRRPGSRPHRPIYRRVAPIALQRLAVEMPDGNLVEIDAFDAAQIDGRHLVALAVRAVRKRLHATGLAEAVIDRALVERVAHEIALLAVQRHL